MYDKVKAQRYASSKTGKPYSVATTKKSTNKYYCSKLVWQSYKNTKGTDLVVMGAHLSHLQILIVHQKLLATNNFTCRFILQVSFFILYKR
ncbi:YiiX/YebB-like N1pC/P60 family cysteine hydrolase [Bacillus amyloliquefaciens]|uniref:YiiX/YebB-like N1pC/P60 family cysteine hydrolase n=1 Tax=Bacillus amyloliquefaciens TaxID=1390 RepID=UPI000B515FAC